MKIILSIFKKVTQSFTLLETIYLGLWSILMILIWKNMLVFDGQYYWAGWINIWGDWSMHFSYIFNFLYRSFPLSNHPLYWGYPFHYHFAADLLSALLMKVGLTIVQATVLPSIFFSILLILTSYIFYRTLYKNKIIASLALVLFFFNGGMGWILFTYHNTIGNISTIVSAPSFELTHIEPWNIRWNNFITAEFIPQRPFLIGLPIAFIILISFWNIYQRRSLNASTKLLVVLAILTGLLPIIHIYSYFVILGMAMYLTTLCAIQKKNIRPWLWYYIPLGLLSTFVFLYLLGTISVSYIRFNPGWMAPDGVVPFVWFWIKNIGIMSILIPISYVIAPRKIKYFSIPFIALFILPNLYIFQPHEWDNRKFLLYWYFFSCGTVAHLLTELYKNKKTLAAVLCIILFYTSVVSGMIDAVNLLHFNKNKYRLFSLQDTQFAQEIRNKTDSESIFLMYPSNSWIGMVLGRQTIMGFEAWIDNIGAVTTDRKRDIERIYQGDTQTTTLLKKYHISYVLIGPQEHSFPDLNEKYFQQRYPILIQNDTSTIYDVRKLVGEPFEK